MSLLIVFGGLVILFVLGLILRKIFPELCAICFAVLSTWISLLICVELGWNQDPVLLPLLAGGSAVGSMYYLGNKLSKSLNLFKLPYLLTAFYFLYSIITSQINVPALLLILGVWVIFGTAYMFSRGNSQLINKIIECCRNW